MSIEKGRSLSGFVVFERENEWKSTKTRILCVQNDVIYVEFFKTVGFGLTAGPGHAHCPEMAQGVILELGLTLQKFPAPKTMRVYEVKRVIFEKFQ